MSSRLVLAKWQVRFTRLKSSLDEIFSSLFQWEIVFFFVSFLYMKLRQMIFFPSKCIVVFAHEFSHMLDINTNEGLNVCKQFLAFDVKIAHFYVTTTQHKHTQSWPWWKWVCCRWRLRCWTMERTRYFSRDDANWNLHKRKKKARDLACTRTTIKTLWKEECNRRKREKKQKDRAREKWKQRLNATCLNITNWTYDFIIINASSLHIIQFTYLHTRFDIILGCYSREYYVCMCVARWVVDIFAPFSSFVGHLYAYNF